jgi:hypothetical protein
MYKHELEIVGIGAPLMYEICEPIGFDGLQFQTEQESKRFARSVNFGALDKIEFVNAVGNLATTPQVKNQFGDISEYLDYGLEWLLYGLEQKGFEFEVYYHLSKDGLYYPKMQLDFSEKDITDGKNYVSCKLIDIGVIMDYKRQGSEIFNAFTNKDFKGNTITPLPTFKYLRRATPVTQISKFRGNNSSVMAQAYETSRSIEGFNILANNSNVVEQYDINNTLSFLSPTFTKGLAFDNNGVLQPIPVDSGSFQFLEAKNDLSNLTFLFKDIVAQVRAVKYNFFGTSVVTATGKARLLMLIGGVDLATEGFDAYELWRKNYADITDFDSIYTNVPSALNISIPFIERSKRVYIFFANDCTATFSNTDHSLANARVETLINGMTIEIKATETAIDSVIKAVNWIDLIKQSSKYISNLPIDAPKFDVGGEYYNNVVFNRRMVSQKTDFFNVKPDDVFGSVEEVCADYEINRNEIFIDSYNGFYTNNEIGVFQIIPSKDYQRYYNDRAMLKSFKYGYKTYEQERTTIGTSNSIHTESEWLLPNLLADNTKEINNNFVRDAYAIQSIIDLEIKQPTTSTNEDDKVYIEEYVALQPNSFGTFGARLLMRIVGNDLEILNRDSNGDSGDVVINWTILGFGVGDNFEITSGVNVGNYSVLAITNSVLTLQPIGFTPSFSGDGFIKVKYFYSNVTYQTRLTQGVILPINNTLSSINYSIKRNILRWGSWIATAMLYNKTLLKNTFFKNNGLFTSQLVGESSSITENANVNYTDLDEPIINANVHSLSLVASYESVVYYMNTYATDRGFVRCYDMQGNIIKGYIQKNAYNPFTKEFNVTLEEKYYTPYLNLTYTNGILNVEGTDYDLGGISNWWIFENDFFRVFDKNSIPICNFYKYNFVILNGVSYSTKLDLQTALLTL